MATKSEQVHAEEQRNARTAKAPAPARSKPNAQSNESERAAKKAAYVLEESMGKPTRKSTRKSANRAKPDAAMTIHQEAAHNTPQARHGRENARS